MGPQEWGTAEGKNLHDDSALEVDACLVSCLGSRQSVTPGPVQMDPSRQVSIKGARMGL